MSRVQIDAQAWGVVQNTAGDSLAGLTVTLNLPGTGTAATHWSAITGGSSSTATLTTNSLGLVTLAGAVRYIDPGSYDMTVSGVLRRVEAAAGTIQYSLVAADVTIYATSAAASAGADQSALIQAAADLCETNGWKLVSGRGGHVKITNTVTFGDMSFDLSDLQVNVDFPYPLAVETPAIKVYHPGALFVNRVSARQVKLPEVVNADRGGSNPRWFIETTTAADPGAAGTALTLSAWPIGWPSSGNFEVRLRSTKSVTAAASTDLFTLNSHGFSADQVLYFSGITGGGGISAGAAANDSSTPYYVLASGLTANNFKVATSAGGTAVDITTDMTAGSVTYQETVLVTAGHGTTSLTITRAQDDTLGAPHAVGAQAATSVSQNDIGVQLVNCEACDIDVPRIVDFSVGLDEAGLSTAGHVYNTVRLGYLTMNRINHRQGQLDSTGWCNSNTYHAGSYGHYDYAAVGIRLPGVRHILQTLIDNFAYHVNDNKWLGGGLENRVAQIEWECGGSHNKLIGTRWEKSNVSPRVYWRDGAVLTVESNEVFLGYGAETVVQKYEDINGSPRNRVTASGGRLSDELSITPVSPLGYAIRIRRPGDPSNGARLRIDKSGEHYWSTAGSGTFDAALRTYGTRQLLMESPENVAFTFVVHRSEPSGTPQTTDMQQWRTLGDVTLAAITKSGAIKLLEQTDTDAGGVTTDQVHVYAKDLSGKTILARRDPSRVELIPGTVQNTATWDPGSLINGAEERKSVTVTGAAVGDAARAGLTTVAATGWKIWATVIAADTVEVTIRNDTGGTVDLASGTVRAVVEKYT